MEFDDRLAIEVKGEEKHWKNLLDFWLVYFPTKIQGRGGKAILGERKMRFFSFSPFFNIFHFFDLCVFGTTTVKVQLENRNQINYFSRRKFI